MRDKIGRFITTHGMPGTQEYRAWGNMLYRCNTESAPNYSGYGGRGIKVCERWNSFECFFSDMGLAPKGTSLERIDVNGGYSPENCKWATPKEQARNRRNNTTVYYNGKEMCLAAFSDAVGIPYHNMMLRWRRGWSVERIAETPVRSYRGAV